ncbi:hypothetical protein F5Y15DRAFT_427162 [Xylariaceae sp. FL0016]|nr:hypothetical protein F5Y15DRAFT_427162 [Xylariaceae sp. FL0016]
MDTLRKLREKLEDTAGADYDALQAPLQSSGKTESFYEDLRSSEDTQTPSPPVANFYPAPPPSNRALKLTIAVLCFALTVLSISHILLLLNPTRTPNKSDQIVPEISTTTTTATQLQTKDCGASVAEAKAKGCTWDELTKAWLPTECPRYGADEFKSEGILTNTHDNATSWTFYADQAGTSEIILSVLAADEARDPDSPVWGTTRQHLTHCAFALKRVIYSYNEGLAQYPKMTKMHHVNHCVDTLLRRALRADPDVDLITTTARVQFGNCTF